MQRLVLFLFALALGGLHYPVVGTAKAVCLPPPGAELAAPPPAAQEPQASPLSGVNVYFDGSGSMAGYFAAPHMGNAYRTLVLDLPRYLGQLSSDPVKVQYFRFGSKIAPVAAKDEAGAGEAKFYERNCPGSTGGNCDNQVSLIGQALDAAEKKPAGDLSLIFTDLFLTNGDLDAAGPNSMLTPLKEILTSGRAVGILGIKTAFEGKIFDMPGHPGGYPHKSRPGATAKRPIFMIMVGKHADIFNFYNTLHQLLLSGMAPDDYAFTLFATSPGSFDEGADEQSPGSFAIPEHTGGLLKIRGTDATYLPPDIPAYKVRQGQRPVTLPMDFAALGRKIAPAGFLLGDFVVEERVWEGLPGPQCMIWKPYQEDAPLGKLVTSVGGGQNVELFTSDAARASQNAGSVLQRMVPGFSYFLKLSVVPKALTLTSENAWLDDWSLSPDAVDATVATQPAFFPALNLDVVGQLLRRIVQDGYKNKLGHPVAVSEIILYLE